MQYRRFRTPGATYFFTVVSYNRQNLFDYEENVVLLRQAFWTVKQRHPFNIDAIVVLPDHIHCLWTLPDSDADFSLRWRLIKSYFSRQCTDKYRQQQSVARLRKKEQAVWQRRFWEHQIRDERDFTNHIRYIHNNPVKHGFVKSPHNWPYSSIHHRPTP